MRRVAALWKFLNLAQELMLLAVVNTKYTSQTLISIFDGGSFLNFDIFSPLFALLPAEYRGEVGYNALTDHAQYHPSISGKMFIVNVKSQLCFFLVSLLGFATLFLLGLKFRLPRRLADSYLFCGLINSVQSCFVDVLLAAFVQVRYFTFEICTLYTFNGFAAFFALVLFDCDESAVRRYSKRYSSGSPCTC